jgi:3',5'-cyclic AMP phosphodiesterase CpdA
VITIVHMSDLHFGPPYVPAVGEALVKATEVIGPDVIVASGDFTQRAKEQQFAEARAFLDRLPKVPTVVVPGNHDVPLYRIVERTFSPYKWYRKYIAEELDYVLDVEGARIVALNSTAPLRATTNGRIDGWQLEFARKAFEGVPDGTARIVVAHHHFAPAPDYEGGQVMPRAKRAVDTFTRLDVDLILGGHLHRAYIGNTLDLYPGRDREHGITIVQSGTSTSRRGRAREREKNSFNVVRVGDDFVRITHYMYFEDLDGFASASRHIFPRNHRFLSDSVTLAGRTAAE